MGAGPALLMACRKSRRRRSTATTCARCASCARRARRCRPRATTGSTSSSHPELLLNVGSGGTDVCTGIVQGGPLQPVYRGEIAGCPLAVDVAAYDIDGAAGRRPARRARDPQADADDAAALLERPGRQPLPRQLLRGVPRRLAPRRLDRVHRARQLRDHRTLGRDAQPRRRAPGDRRVLHRRRDLPGDRGQPRRAPRGRRGRAGRADPLRRARPRARSSTRSCARASPPRCARRCRRGTCRTRSRSCRRSRAR